MPPLPRLTAPVALILTLAAEASAVDIKLGAPFGDHMVVQRDRPIRVWGEASPGAKVDVRFGPREAFATAGPDGRWSATLEALPAGGPHRLSAAAEGASAGLEDVLVGDVWLCSGQSNMQMTLRECDGGPAAADSAGKLAGLRLASVGRRASPTPATTAEVRWRAASPESARGFSGVGFFFAAALLADPALAGVPVGVVDSSFGGSMCEAWVPKEALGGFDPADLRVSLFGAGPSGLYNGMIAPLGRAPIKGVVWYQGEGNADRPGAYPRLLAALVESWRERFETPGLPFVVVGLPDWAAGSGGISWAWLREAQEAAVRGLPHASLAVGIGTTDGFDLHPRQKAELGRRAALLALRDAYGRPIVAAGPSFREARAEGGALRLAFDTGGDGLASRGGGPVRGFAVAGEDGRSSYADAAIDGDSVVLRSDEVPAPRTARYAWAGVPDATLTNRSGLPAPPFRTDTSPPPDADVQRQPVARHVRMKSYEVTVAGHGAVTSLGVGGRQFLSNELGSAGGTSVPGWLGARTLAEIREPGPGRLTCGDGDVTVLMEFAEAGMRWEVANRSKDGIKFRVALAPKVEVEGKGGSGPLTLTRKDATLIVTGVDAVAGSEDGPILETNVPGRSSRRLELTVGDRPRPSR